MTKQATAKADIQATQGRVAHCDRGTAQAADCSVQGGLYLCSRGVEGQRCRGVRLPGVAQRQLKAATGATAVYHQLLHLGHVGLRSLQGVYTDFTRRKAKACFGNINKLQGPHKADAVSLGLRRGLVIGDADVGSIGAQRCGVGGAQVGTILSMRLCGITGHKATCDPALNRWWADRSLGHQTHVLTGQTAAKTQTKLCSRSPVDQLNLRPAEGSKCRRHHSLHLRLRHARCDLSRGVGLTCVTQTQCVTHRLSVAADFDRLHLCTGRNTLGKGRGLTRYT